VMLDDATSEILAARFTLEETTDACLAVLIDVLKSHGTFGSLYTDRASHFVHTPEAGGKPDRSKPSQVERILDELGIELIVAYSPQARGRGERMFGTLQGRLPNELRRAGITDYEGANCYLNDIYLPKHNRNFATDPAQEVTGFLPVAGVDLERVCAKRYERKVRRDNTIQFETQVLQLPKLEGVSTLAGRKVDVRKHLDHTLEVLIGRRLVARFEADDADGTLKRQEAI